MEKAVNSFLFIMIFGFIIRWLLAMYAGEIIEEMIGSTLVIALATARITYVIEKCSKK